jgi:prepilin-type N-terminal cleavage/methylation domain-containing protein
MQEKGFTLVEIMLSILLLAIVLGLGTASFGRILANNRMAVAVNDLVSSLHAARSEAITRRATVVICPAPGGQGDCDPGASLAQGWQVFADDNQNGTRDAGETLLLSYPGLPGELVDGFSAMGRPGAGNFISFNALGQLPPAGEPLANTLSHFQVCDFRGDADTGDGVAAGRWIEVLPTGWPQVHRLRERVQAGPLGGC